MTTREYIRSAWKETVRKPNPITAAGAIKLPKPYSVPCKGNGGFDELYYWDTYFLNRGLFLSDQIEQAKNNIENFMALIDFYGYIPNGSKSYLDRSQPPLFGLMIRDFYGETHDKIFLENALVSLKKEMHFWETKRTGENGLSFYSTEATKEALLSAVQMYRKRTGVESDLEEEYWGKNVLAEAESGWDFNARFAGKCHEYNPVDLNAILYFNETFIAYAEQTLGVGDGAEWLSKAALRRAKMNEYMVGTDGVYYDYSYVDNKQSVVKSAASFFPYFTGVAVKDDGIDALLSDLELGFGIQASVETNTGNFQWEAQNGWPCLQVVAVEGLLNCGRVADALRIAEKYKNLMDDVFQKTGRLFEKYNVLFGDDAEAVGEYGTPEMLGWTAGCYLIFEKLLKDDRR